MCSTFESDLVLVALSMTNMATVGKSFPLGATVYGSGVNFSVYSKSATGVQLVLFERADDDAPNRVIELDGKSNRTGDYWHVFVPECRPGQCYGYRVDGPSDPRSGHRYDREKVLIDPYGKCVSTCKYDRSVARRIGENISGSMKSVVADSREYDWDGDVPIHRPFWETVIYEVHVAGFTGHVSSDVDPEKRGTYSGLVEKIPYLQSLGVTCVELLPSSNSTLKTLLPAFPTIGDTLQSLSLLRTPATVRGLIR
jgi:isoamylase